MADGSPSLDQPDNAYPPLPDAENPEPPEYPFSGDSGQNESEAGGVVFTAQRIAAAATLGVLALPVSVPVLLVCKLTSYRSRRHRAFHQFLKVYTRVVPLSLLLSLILLLVLFRVHPSLKHHENTLGLETWRWLEIALVCCVFYNVWVGRSLILEIVGSDENTVFITDKIRRAINCICFIVAEFLVLKVAPLTSAESVSVYDVALWKWLLSLVSLFCAWYVIGVVTFLMVVGLELWQTKEIKRAASFSTYREEMRPRISYVYAVFLAKGLRRRINAVLLFMSIILTWIFYVKHQLQFENSREHTKKVYDFVFRSFLSLLIGSVLSLVLKFLLLLWEPKQLRFDSLFDAYMQLFIIDKIWGNRNETFGNRQARVLNFIGGTKVLHRRLKASLGPRVHSYDMLKRSTALFRDIEELWQGGKIEDLLARWQNKRLERSSSRMTLADLVASMIELYGFQLSRQDAKYLYQELKKVRTLSKDVHFVDFEDWMSKAYKNCKQIANNLGVTMQLIEYLDMILIAMNIIVCFVVWLFLTRIATLKVLVLAISPVIAAAFIFGETAKNLFQGMMFVYVACPFVVGDICVMGGNQLVVRSIMIWKTAFYKRGCHFEEVLYPNSILLNTTITKYENDLDRDDSLEFSVKNYASLNDATYVLPLKIKYHLEENRDLELDIQQVSVKEIEEDIKMVVHFTYMKKFGSMTDGECQKYKIYIKSQILLAIRKFVDKVRREKELRARLRR